MSDGDLHPEARNLLDELAAVGSPPSAALSPAGARDALREVLVGRRPTVPVGRVREIPIEGPGGDLVLRCYEPDTGNGDRGNGDGSGEDDDGAEANGSVPILVYYHGGGWVRGDLDTHDELCRYFTAELGCLTVAVDYRRAPEHPFPAALADAEAAVRWVVANAAVFGADPDRVAVAGDSAGGNLAAGVALAARDRGGPALVHQVLLYPVTNHAFDTDSYERHADNAMLSRATMEWYWNHYLAREFDGANPYASPLRARDLSDLPPATVLTAGHDPLRDEGEAYAGRLAGAGVPTTYTDYEGMVHAFVSFPSLDRARDAREEVVAALGEAFASGE
jgi:acetyl esterase